MLVDVDVATSLHPSRYVDDGCDDSTTTNVVESEELDEKVFIFWDIREESDARSIASAVLLGDGDESNEEEVNNAKLATRGTPRNRIVSCIQVKKMENAFMP